VTSPSSSSSPPRSGSRLGRPGYQPAWHQRPDRELDEIRQPSPALPRAVAETSVQVPVVVVVVVDDADCLEENVAVTLIENLAASRSSGLDNEIPAYPESHSGLGLRLEY
jgi:hypothetical protein